MLSSCALWGCGNAAYKSFWLLQNAVVKLLFSGQMDSQLNSRLTSYTYERKQWFGNFQVSISGFDKWRSIWGVTWSQFWEALTSSVTIHRFKWPHFEYAGNEVVMSDISWHLGANNLTALLRSTIRIVCVGDWPSLFRWTPNILGDGFDNSHLIPLLSFVKPLHIESIDSQVNLCLTLQENTWV